MHHLEPAGILDAVTQDPSLHIPQNREQNRPPPDAQMSRESGEETYGNEDDYDVARQLTQHPVEVKICPIAP